MSDLKLIRNLERDLSHTCKYWVQCESCGLEFVNVELEDILWGKCPRCGCEDVIWESLEDWVITQYEEMRKQKT